MAQLPIKHGERTQIVTVRMAQSDWKLVKARAKSEGISMSAFIRQSALSSALAGEQESLRRLVKDAEDVAENIRRIMSSASVGDNDDGEANDEN